MYLKPYISKDHTKRIANFGFFKERNNRTSRRRGYRERLSKNRTPPATKGACHMHVPRVAVSHEWLSGGCNSGSDASILVSGDNSDLALSMPPPQFTIPSAQSPASIRIYVYINACSLGHIEVDGQRKPFVPSTSDTARSFSQ